MANQLYQGSNPLATTCPNVVDNLTSTSSTDALSAKQGKVLNDKIDEVDSIKYVRGLFSLSSGTTSQEYITQTISQINTENKFTNFDVNVSRYGTHKFTGYIYPAKNYGSGIFQNFEGQLIFWRRNTANNVTTDYFYNITKAVI